MCRALAWRSKGCWCACAVLVDVFPVANPFAVCCVSYLSLLDNHKTRPLRRQAQLVAQATSRVDAVFASSIARMPARSRHLLERLAYAQPDSVPYGVLKEWISNSEKTATHVDDAVEPLVVAHLVRRVGVDGDAVSIHRVLQDAVRRRVLLQLQPQDQDDQDNDDEQKGAAAYDALVDVVDSVGRCFKYDHSATDHSGTRQWAPHVASVAEHALKVFAVSESKSGTGAATATVVVGPHDVRRD